MDPKKPRDFRRPIDTTGDVANEIGPRSSNRDVQEAAGHVSTAADVAGRAAQVVRDSSASNVASAATAAAGRGVDSPSKPDRQRTRRERLARPPSRWLHHSWRASVLLPCWRGFQNRRRSLRLHGLKGSLRRYGLPRVRPPRTTTWRSRAPIKSSGCVLGRSSTPQRCRRPFCRLSFATTTRGCRYRMPEDPAIDMHLSDTAYGEC